jgi:hypothetical protein
VLVYFEGGESVIPTAAAAGDAFSFFFQYPVAILSVFFLLVLSTLRKNQRVPEYQEDGIADTNDLKNWIKKKIAWRIP